MSLRVEAQRPLEGQPGKVATFSQGTGFIAERHGSHYLVTNWHIATNRSRTTQKPLGEYSALPHTLRVAFVCSSPDGDYSRWISATIPLYDEAGKAMWFVHPSLKQLVDVVAILLQPLDRWPAMTDGYRVVYEPYSVDDPPADVAAALLPGGDVNVIGYPFGLSGGNDSAIWSRATVATEPDLDYADEPCFLVDSRTRQGQSGSPVIGFWTGMRPLLNGGNGAVYGAPWEFFGVYSGRVSPESDLGRVWKRSAVREIIDARQRDTIQRD